MASSRFGRFAGACGVLAGVNGLLYAVAFIGLQNALLTALYLMLGGLLATAVFTAVYQRIREVDRSFALWGIGLATFGALGSIIHGGYDLASAINPPAAPNVDLPNSIDPRGLLTFGVSGIGLFVIAWLMGKSAQFPKQLSTLGYVLAALSVILYLGRLIVLAPSNPLIFVPALVAGFVVNPAWYIWTGLTLRRGGSTPS